MIVSVKNATVRHLDKVLFKDLSLRIDKGEVWAFLGDSGSGKTALLYTIYGHFNVINGSVSYPALAALKKEWKIDSPLFSYDKMMAFVRQQAHFKNKENRADFFYQQRYHAHFSQEASTVFDYLKEQEEELTQEDIPVRYALNWIIEHLDLKNLLEKTLIQLSNGETRRLMIAKALLEQPVLLLMDNPFIGLDVETRPVLEKLLNTIIQKGTAVVMATSMREIPEAVTHIAYLKKGKVLYSGTKSGFLSRQKQYIKGEEHCWTPDADILSEIKKNAPRQSHEFERAISLKNTGVKSGGKIILQDINWEVYKGDKWALVGHNGAGKSTLLSLINGDHPQAYANDISIFDQQKGGGETIWDLKRRIGYVSPEMHQYFKADATVIEVVLSGLHDTMYFKLLRAKPQEVALADHWLDLLGLKKERQQRLKDLSSGRQRLVLLLRAMIKNPPLLILDEPCQGLDEEQKNHFKNIVNLLWSSKDKTLLYVSHYKEDIPSVVNKVIELENGKIKP